MNNPYKHQEIALQRYRHASEIPLFFDPGTGKLLVKDTPVLTPKGYVPIKDIQVGDMVCGYDQVSKVTQKFHEMNAEIYRITFSDHTTIDACKDHLWYVKDNRNTRKRRLNIWEVKSTQQILNEGLYKKNGASSSLRWDIPVCQPVEFDQQDLPIKPYTLGALIGDGSLTGKQTVITTVDNEILSNVRDEGYDIKRISDTINYHVSIPLSQVPDSIRTTSYYKHIPDIYLINSIENRIKLLQGLIDTDGYVDLIHQRNGGLCPALKYCTTSEQLYKDITFLVQSLGGIVTGVDVRKGQYEGEEKATRWVFTIILPRDIEKQCCTLPRKRDRLLSKEPKQKLHRKIVSIEYIGKQEGYCLTVDNPDATYLIDHCIVTHNTRTSLLIAAAKYQQGDIDAVLVIAPNGVHKQWATEEIPKWMSDIDTTVQWRKNKKLFFVEGKLNIVCTNIEQFSTKTRYLDYVEWVNAHRTMIILDEATRIKNPKAIRTQRLLYEFNNVVKRGKTVLKSEPRTVARAILTGTPVTNGPFDVWPMFEFLRPGYFGVNWYGFQNKYGMFHAIQVNGRVIRILINEEAWNEIHRCDSFDCANALFGVSLGTFDTIKQQDHYEGPFKNVDSLRDKMLEIAMFVKIEDCIDMPERSYNRKLLDMSAEQKRVYNELEKYFITMYKDETVEAKSKLTAYIRLQQIASGFVSSEQVPEDELEDPPPNKITWFDDLPKFDQLLCDIEEIVGSTDNPTGQAIIVCHFSAEAERIFDSLEHAGYHCCLQTGWKKVGTLEAFKQQKYPILVANIRVISMGFNLQEHCHHMIFYSNTFSLEDRIQVEARIYRAGQKNKCIYLDYVMKDTIDMKVYAALKQKKQLADYIRDTSVQDFLETPDEVFNEEYTITSNGEEVVIF